MANYALGIVGGVVGAYFGGPAGASAGFSLGFALGTAIDPAEAPTIDGPRLSDLSPQTSSEGGMIAIGFGCYRVGGNVVWANDLTEITSTTSSGGKGAPSGPKVNERKYFLNQLVSVCESPGFISRIWANEKVIYDARSIDALATVQEIDPDLVQGVVAGETVDEFVIVIFPGAEDQEPPAQIEEILGVGNVPAYRGQVTVLFNQWPLEEFGNQAPNFSFEVCRCCFDSEIEIIGPPDELMVVGETFEFTHTGTDPSCGSEWKIIGGVNDGLTHSGPSFIVTAMASNNAECDENFIVSLNDECVFLPIGVNNTASPSVSPAVRSPRWIASDLSTGCFLVNTSFAYQQCDGVKGIRPDFQVNQTQLDCMSNRAEVFGFDYRMGPNGCSGACSTPPGGCLINTPPACLGIGEWFQCGRYGFFPYSRGYRGYDPFFLSDQSTAIVGYFPGEWLDFRRGTGNLSGNCCPSWVTRPLDPSILQTDTRQRGAQYWNKLPTEENGQPITVIQQSAVKIVPPSDKAGTYLFGDEPEEIRPSCCWIPSSCPNGEADCPECFPWLFPRGGE
jgi:hypothetical protein